MEATIYLFVAYLKFDRKLEVVHVSTIPQCILARNLILLQEILFFFDFCPVGDRNHCISSRMECRWHQLRVFSSYFLRL